VSRKKREEVRVTYKQRSFFFFFFFFFTRHRILHSMQLQVTCELDVSNLRYSLCPPLDIERHTTHASRITSTGGYQCDMII